MTIDPRHLELMHAEIDGVSSEAERGELRELLASSPAAQEQLDQLRRLSETLAGVGLVEPPEELKSVILRAVRPAHTRESASVRERVRTFWPGARVVFAYGYAVAAGLVLGIAVVHWAPTTGNASRGLDPSELVGTMASHGGYPPTSIIGRVPIEFPGGSGTATLRRAEAGYTVEVEVDSQVPVEVRLGFDPGKALFRGFAQDPGAVSELQAGAGRVVWTQSGRQRLAVLMSPLTPAETALAIELFSSGKSLQRKMLSVPGKG